jgi:hypothetical protein
VKTLAGIICASKDWTARRCEACKVKSSENLVGEPYHTTLLDVTIHSIVEISILCKG